MFHADQVEHYLRDLLTHENFAEGALTLHLSRDPTIKEKAPNSHRDSARGENSKMEEYPP